MSRITAKFELDDIYSLSQKTNAGMTTDEKIRTLISLCTVVEKLHSCGQIFGDFNPNNIKIDNNCNVKFVDSDSYHSMQESQYILVWYVLPAMLHQN